MLRLGILNSSAMHSILASNSVIHPESQMVKRTVAADLLLTALIDAFSILVIFLLMSFSSTGEIISVGKGMELPNAKQGETLERTPIMKVDGDKFFLESKEILPKDMTQALLDLRADFQKHSPNQEFPATMTLQADRRVKYEVLNQVVVAAAQAGISDIKFAVLMK
jgi:biopolymer transport protein ExbD